MDIFLVPNSVLQGARSCRLTVHSTEPVQLLTCNADGQLTDICSILGQEIVVKRNGSYTLKYLLHDVKCEFHFSIFHLGKFRGFDGGVGSPESPFLISTCQQFNAIRKNLHAHYKLTSDLHFEKEMNGIAWIPLGRYRDVTQHYNPKLSFEEQDVSYSCDYGFYGELDGAHHTIFGLQCYATAKDDAVALFGATGGGAYIHDLRLQGCRFFEADEKPMATIIGLASNATRLIRCEASASIEAKDTTVVGGLIACAFGDVICQCCKFEGTLRNASRIPFSGSVGGIIGRAEISQVRSQIENCHVHASILGGSYCGGILTGTADIRNCLTEGEIRGRYESAGIAAQCELSKIENCICAMDTIEDVNANLASEQIGLWVAHREAAQCLAVGPENVLPDHMEYVEDAWHHSVSRIASWDPWLTVPENPLNYALEYCALMAQGVSHFPREATLCDGTTIFQHTIAEPDFLQSIGWDMDIWHIKNGRLQLCMVADDAATTMNKGREK